MIKGWISLHRSIASNELWLDKPFAKGQAWIDILLECNHKSKSVSVGTKLVLCKRGESVKSLKTWSKRWGWSIGKTRGFLKYLENNEMIRTIKDCKSTHLRVCKYDTYQNSQLKNESFSATNNKVNKKDSECGLSDKFIKHMDKMK
jgi:DNA replication protein DnaD